MLPDDRSVEPTEEEREEPKYWISDDLRLRIRTELRLRPRLMTKIAERCGVSLGTIQQIEKEGGIKSTAILPKLSAALGFDWVEYVVPHELQRKLIRALETVRKEAGDEVAAEFAVEAERLARRIIAEAKQSGTARPQAPEEAFPIPP